MFVDTRTALKPALQGLTVDQNVDAQINYVRQSLLEGPQLEKIAKETGVLPPVTGRARARQDPRRFQQSHRADRVQAPAPRATSAAPPAPSTAFTTRIRAATRTLERGRTLLNTFVEQTLGGKREGSENAQKFLETQIKDYEQRLSAAEDKLAAFKKKNVGLMPSEQGGYFAQLQKETDDAKKAETDLSIALSRREELAKQLHSDEAISAAGSSAPTPERRGAARRRHVQPHPGNAGEAR